MKIALAIFQLRKLGGRERDCIELARFLQDRGHEVVIITTSLPTTPPAIPLVIIQTTGWANHARVKRFADAVRKYKTQHTPDVLVTFERMGSADFWYAADIAVAEETEEFWSWKPRRLSRRKLEAELFKDNATTHAFFLTPQQRASYSRHYCISPSRSSILPVVVHRNRVAAAARYKSRPARIRRLLGIPTECFVAISICLNAKLKGIDRTLEALVQFPNVHLVVVGVTDHWIRSRAAALGIRHRVHLIPYRAEIMPMLSAADFMVHPARLEAAGQVIVEAMLAGTPAIVTNACGYAPEIERLQAGIVLPEPFVQTDLVAAIATLVNTIDAAKQRARSASHLLAQAADDWLHHIAESIEQNFDTPGDNPAEAALAG